MDMALDVAGDRVFAPAPFRECAGEEFQLAAGRGKATFYFAINLHSHQSTPVSIAVWSGHRNDIRRGGFCGPREYSAETILSHIFEFFSPDRLFIERAYLFIDFESAISPHELQRRKVFCRGLLRQAR